MHHQPNLSIDSAFWHPGHQMHQMSRMQVDFFADEEGGILADSEFMENTMFPSNSAFIQDLLSQ